MFNTTQLFKLVTLKLHYKAYTLFYKIDKFLKKSFLILRNSLTLLTMHRK